MSLGLIKTDICLVDENNQVFLEGGILIEGNGLCAIYTDGYFNFVCTSVDELSDLLKAKKLFIREIKEERLCSECKRPMREGFYFESDGTQYCSEKCLTSVVSWETYLEIYDDGNGDAYWTSWEE